MWVRVGMGNGGGWGAEGGGGGLLKRWREGEGGRC